MKLSTFKGHAILFVVKQISCSSEWVPKSDIKPFDHVSKSESIGPDFGYSEKVNDCSSLSIVPMKYPWYFAIPVEYDA